MMRVIRIEVVVVVGLLFACGLVIVGCLRVVDVDEMEIVAGALPFHTTGRFYQVQNKALHCESNEFDTVLL